jgi:hypothetical protein
MKLKAFITIFGALAVLTAQMWPLSTKDFVSAAAAAESKLTLEQILDRVENHYKDKSFKAEFVQESTLKAMDITDFASGIM